jgi:predicted dehydrogenase
MKILIVGAGRMGIRHAIGASLVSNVENIILVDISENALENSKNQLLNQEGFQKFSFINLNDLESFESNYDVGIIATTAQDRLLICEKVVNAGCKNILIEKPLGQNISEVSRLANFFKSTNSKSYVNLNMRLYPDYIKLKHDLNNTPQFFGEKIITLNTGTLGIGANGIHYLDYLIFLLDAEDVKIIACNIDNEYIPSARGSQFKDFGGWCLLEFFSKNIKVGTAFISMSANSTVFGGFDIVSSHGRITINESNGIRMDYLRDGNSIMPMNRYHADYLEPISSKFSSPSLSDLTSNWINSLSNGNPILPNLEESLLAHKVMFEWLSKSYINGNNFPIT